MSGIGNQMFQYAYALYLREKGIDVRIDTSWYSSKAAGKDREYQLHNLNISIPIANINFFWRNKVLKHYGDDSNIWYRLAEHQLGGYQIRNLEHNPEKYVSPHKIRASRNNCYISGYFQDYRIPREIKQLLLHEIELKQPLVLDTKMMSVLEGRAGVAVSLHIRRGDYLRERRLSPCPIEYYIKAMDYFEKKCDSVCFCIFTDDIKWVKKSEIMHHNCMIMNENRRYSDLEELFLMSKCTHHIIANSTFSWWGAWLNRKKDKTVIVPERWFNYNQQSKIIPPKWIKM